MAFSKKERREKIKRKIRGRLAGTAEVPRLSVFRSNKGIYAQIIDDNSGVTLVAVSFANKEIADKEISTKIEQAAVVGELLAKKAIEKGVSTVVFDRNGFLFHGRVKSLAEAARKGGLKF